MRRITIILIMFCISIHSFGQYFPVDTSKLNCAFRELVNKPNTIERQKKFIDAFPSTWREFIMTYQYVPDKQYDLTMYKLGNDHISIGLGQKLTLINDSTYCNKLIALSIGGQWESDAPRYLKSVLHKTIWNKMESMFSCLSKYSRNSQLQFWQFYWSSLHKKKNIKKDFNRLKKLMTDSNPTEVKIMETAFNYSFGGSLITNNFPHLD